MSRAIICGMLVCLVLPAIAAAQVTGVERMVDLWSLPDAETGVLTLGTASFDRTGMNEDGFVGLFSRLYFANGRHVLYDAEGPGCVYRMWFTNLSEGSRLQIFADDMTQPVVDADIQDFFAGLQPPFKPPLVWDDEMSSGGFVSYLPICYQQRLVIATAGITFFYNFTAQQYAADVSVETFTGTEDYTEVAALYEPAAAGTDPKDTADVVYQTHTVALPARGAATLLARVGPGQIASLRLTPGKITNRLLSRVRLRVFFDGATEPAVDLPLSLFVGSADRRREVHALLFGLRDGTLYSFWPMPFFTAAKIELVNQSPSNFTIETEIGILPEPPGDAAGLFHAVENVSAPPTLWNDHVLADVNGQGKIVGVVQFASGQSGRGYLEGDERFYPDGLRTPTMHGTGTEDYYNGGWYFNRGRFSLPTHGYPFRRQADGWDTTGMYRVHPADTLNYADGALFSIEHDALNMFVDEDLRTATFHYHIDEPALVLEAEFDVGDAAAEAEFLYEGTDDEPTGFDPFFYEGDHDLDLIIDSGYRSAGTVTFTVPVNPANDGVRLVRRMDQAQGRELVAVRVNGRDAGLWRTSDRNQFKRWRDAVLDLPASLTKGADALEIELTNLAPERPFTHYRYWVLSWKKPVLTRLVTLDLTAPRTELAVGDTVDLIAGGAYRSGNVDDVAGWAVYTVSDPGRAAILDGRLTALSPGEVTIVARAGNAISNPLTIRISGK